MLKRIAQLGGILIFISGVVNLLLGIQVGALVYEIYPGGRMGHVGIVAGLAAMVSGILIVHLAAPRLDLCVAPAATLPVADGTAPERRASRAAAVRRRRLGAFMVFALGLFGAIAGALYVGTLGMAFCCVAAGWAFFAQPS